MTTRIITDGNGRKHITNEPLLHPEQEPVAWISKERSLLSWDKFYDDMQPLYTTSLQRPWIGLTDEDRYKFAAAQYGWEDLLIAAEAKLKEKNG